MILISAGLLFAVLSRAEVLERFKAEPVTQVSGLVRVWANCPTAMRREFQVPVATEASEICKRLYQSRMLHPQRFKEPAIVVYLGENTNSVTNVIAKVSTLEGALVTKLYLPAPAYYDHGAFCHEVVKGFIRAIDKTEPSDAAAVAELRRSYPELKLADEYAELKAWRAGERGDAEDDKFLKLQRKVFAPGHATAEDVRLFASRLFLFPEFFGLPFCGQFDSCSFKEAIALAKVDPMVRLAAYKKAMSLTVYGGGRGERMDEAVKDYVKFLLELATGKRTELELHTMLSSAEEKLKGAIE